MAYVFIYREIELVATIIYTCNVFYHGNVDVWFKRDNRVWQIISVGMKLKAQRRIWQIVI